MILRFVQLPGFFLALTFQWLNCPFYNCSKKRKKRFLNGIPWFVPKDPNLQGERTILSLRKCQELFKVSLRISVSINPGLLGKTLLGFLAPVSGDKVT